MANNLQIESFIPTGLEIVLYHDQETQKWRDEYPNTTIAAEPLRCWEPKEVSGAVEGDAPTRKRKRSELEVEKDKEFTLLELYKSSNIHEIILQRQKDEITLDAQELLKNLKGWTVEKRKRFENGKDRVDKTYRHPKSKRVLRSLVKVKNFIEEISCMRQLVLDNGEGGLQFSLQATQSNLYLQLYKKLENTYSNGDQQTFNDGSNKGSSFSWSEQREAITAPKTTRRTTFNSHDTVDLSLHSQRPLHYQERMNENRNAVPQAEQISDLSKQVLSNLMRSNGQECVRTFGVRQPPCDVFGASSSSTNITFVDEIKMMVQSQELEAQIEARVAAQVAKKLSQYEKTQRDMVEKMKEMQHLLELKGMLTPPQLPNTRSA